MKYELVVNNKVVKQSDRIKFLRTQMAIENNKGNEAYIRGFGTEDKLYMNGKKFYEKPLVKPRLGSHIYVYMLNSFEREQIIAVGKELFFHSGSLKVDRINEYREPLYFSDYKTKWFKSLKEIKKKYKIKKITEDYYVEEMKGNEIH